MADDPFQAFVLDQLAGRPGLRARAMFGAHGLYSADHFFAILAEGRVFFKVDETTRTAYESRGMKSFTYEVKGRRLTISYSEVPPEVLEDRNEALAWANLAIQVAAAKTGKKRGLRKQS